MRLTAVAIVSVVALAVVEARCPNSCSGHGTCTAHDICDCFDGTAGAAWEGIDCSQRVCPTGTNRAGAASPCSDQGACDRSTGECACFPGFDGSNCERILCPGNCNGHGACLSLSARVANAPQASDLTYSTNNPFGCKCDSGYRGPDCSLRECPSGDDEMGGPGSADGRDCSGRGLCNYDTGICACFSGYTGSKCENQSALV